MELKKNYSIKTGYGYMDIQAIHQFLCMESYWAKGISKELVEKALQHSFCVGVFLADKQIGFARLITDYTTFAYLADVYILEQHRGEGLSKKLMEYIMGLDDVKGMRRILLATLDAHALYSKFGFQSPEHPERLMEIRRNNLYSK
ncbi:MAG: GNAT family N-acetyltransferase [Cytophagales bacterium]|nr:GNAT family N-acetyltransferase [Cytophagales bacterium]|tara:strand:- start:26731 stop:27165 length:435 start_codon:yes stop_codon:yes gene_type:complete